MPRQKRQLVVFFDYGKCADGPRIGQSLCHIHIDPKTKKEYIDTKEYGSLWVYPSVRRENVWFTYPGWPKARRE